MLTSAPSIPKSRARLSRVLQQVGDLVSVADVSRTLQLERSQAAKLLSRWRSQGWLRRLRHGVYAPVPLTALGQEQVLDDPWVVVPELFGPAYIGGWSAAEHWGLTEQLFRSVCVLTTRPIRNKNATIQGVAFSLKHIRAAAMFGTRPLWRGRIKVEISGPAKTIIDMLDDPALGGGIRHVNDCLDAFLKDGKAPAKELITTAERLGNGAAFKRLGFLLERRGGPAELIAACRERLTTGNAKLDPALPSPRLVTRWRLWSPSNWAPGEPGRSTARSCCAWSMNSASSRGSLSSPL
jgi:predicted transcriptional regulator of viral defense system